LKKLESELQQQLKKISDMQKINEELELANSNLRNEIIAVQGEKNEAVASIVNLESDLEQQSEMKNAAIAQLHQLEDNLKNLQSELEQKQDEILVLKYTNEELQDINSSLHRHLEETRTKMQTEISALKGERKGPLIICSS
jgi:chromosome segregation ATPase